MTNIQWTDKTWNPMTGCTKISTGCKHCYAETMANRLYGMGKPKYANKFTYTEHKSAVNMPLTWKKPCRIFVNSMSDMFHEDASMDFVSQCFEIMMQANQHTYQILTKRPYRMRRFAEVYHMVHGHIIPNHIWMGTSIESEEQMVRADILRTVECSVRFISCEPLLGPLSDLNLNGIHWVIIGGESGYGHRPIRKEWVTEIIDKCRRHHIPVFFKQWGGTHPKSNGHLIDGISYQEYPDV